MTQEELALKLNYKSISSINKIEASGRGLPQSKIVAIAKALNTTPSYLMGWDDAVTLTDFKITSSIEPVVYKKKIPILGLISAGLPVLASEHIEGYKDVEDESLDYALKVKGDSMTGARICEDDIVYVRRDCDITNGDIVIALINGDDATVTDSTDTAIKSSCGSKIRLTVNRNTKPGK